MEVGSRGEEKTEVLRCSRELFDFDGTKPGVLHNPANPIFDP